MCAFFTDYAKYHAEFHSLVKQTGRALWPTVHLRVQRYLDGLCLSHAVRYHVCIIGIMPRSLLLTVSQ